MKCIAYNSVLLNQTRAAMLIGNSSQALADAKEAGFFHCL